MRIIVAVARLLDKPMENVIQVLLFNGRIISLEYSPFLFSKEYAFGSMTLLMGDCPTSLPI